MERDQIQSFVTGAEDQLASIRSGLLLTAQTGGTSDIGTIRRSLELLRGSADRAELPTVRQLCCECDEALEQLAVEERVSPGAVYSALDIVARIEAAVWDVPIRSEGFIEDVAGFVEASFNELVPKASPQPEPKWESSEFEIDDETLEIFRGEADELLSRIAENLGILSASPTDQAALWEIRRSAHTFKGASGIVGLESAAEVAHRMEDLLDTMVETRREASSPVIDFLLTSSRALNNITRSKDVNLVDLSEKFEAALACVSNSPTSVELGDVGRRSSSVAVPELRVDPVRPPAGPIVRVSLDRLDELIRISRNLIVNRSAIFERLNELGLLSAWSGGELDRLEPLLDAQRALTDDMQEKLLKIRMVRFGTLETRLSRNVHVTCVDQEKKAVLEIENSELEIDTQLIDALIEPLIHLLKNAVVHGIEPPETRRLVGKPERGTISVRVDVEGGSLRLTVRDDGAGISASKLRERAVAMGRMTRHQADSINDRDAIQLIFDRGLTTADRVDLNAGRGVGMSIVKEAIEARGGTIVIDSIQTRGTTFSIVLPLEKPLPAEIFIEHDPSESVDARPMILVVEDSASIRRQTVKLIEKCGARAITANHGAEALELLLNGEWEPDLILSDVEMPHIDGWGFLEYVKTDVNFGHIPVVMVTSLSSDDHRRRASDLGAADYIVKPLCESELDRVLNSLVKPAATEQAVC